MKSEPLPKPALKTLEKLLSEYDMEAKTFAALVEQFLSEIPAKERSRYNTMYLKSRSMLQMCQYTRDAAQRFIEAKYALSPSRIIRWPFTDLFDKLFPAGPEGY
jgi:hypothetical protein